jgi:hypothetical protein
MPYSGQKVDPTEQVADGGGHDHAEPVPDRMRP